MWLKAVRRKPTKTRTRLLSTSSPNPEPSTHDLLVRKVYRISRYYGRKSDDPIFKLFNSIVRNPQAMVPLPMLHRSGITIREYNRWKPIVLASNWQCVTEHLRRNDVTVPELDAQGQPSNTGSQPPTWVVLYALCYKVQHCPDALEAWRLAYFHLDTAPPRLRPALLMLVACWLAEHDLLAPLSRTLSQLFQSDLSIDLQDFHIQLLLQLLAFTSQSREVSGIICKIIAASHGHSLNASTFDAVLRSRSATAFTALAVSRKMKVQGFQPTLRHLTQLIALYTTARWRRRAQTVLRLLRLHMATTKGESIPADSKLHLLGSSVPTSMTSESLYVSALVSIDALHEYLRDALTRHQYKNDMVGEPDIAGGDYEVDESGSTSFQNLDVIGARVQAPSSGPLEDLPASTASALLQAAGVWKSAMVVASRDTARSSEELHDLYDRAIKAHPLLRLYGPIHVVAINGFLRRRDHASALKFWEILHRHQRGLTKWTLAAGVKVLTLSNHPMQALDLLYEATELETRSQSKTRMIDTQTINTFMVSLQRTGFTDAIFVLWEHMEEMFGIRRDLYTLTTLLSSARFSSRCDPSFRGALVELGLGRLLKPWHKPKSDKPSRDTYFSAVETTLHHELSKGPTGLWNGERAGVVALRAMQDILMDNWPELRDVRSPAEALRPTGDFQGTFPMTSLLRSMLQRHPPAVKDDSNAADTSQQIQSTLRYPHIVPNDVTFRTYIDLLAAESRIPQIPLALAWMRTLGIKPSRETLATALVYWAEVGMYAPLFEQFRDGTSQYARLKYWMQEWVGEKAMPRDGHMATQIRRLKYFRDHPQGVQHDINGLD